MMANVRDCNRVVHALVPSYRNCQRGVSITLIVCGVIAIIVGSLALYNQLFTSLSGFYKFPSLSGFNRSYSIMLIVGGGISSLIGMGGVLHF